MEFVVAARLNPCGLLQLPHGSVKEGKARIRHTSNVNPYTSPDDLRSIASVSVFPDKTGKRSSTLESRSRGWCKAHTASGIRNMYSQHGHLVDSGEVSLRLVEMRNSQKFWQPMKCSKGRAPKDFVCSLSSNLVDSYVGSPYGDSRKFRSQLDKQAILWLETVRSSNIFNRKNRNGSMYSIRTSSVRGDYCFGHKEETMDIAGVSSSHSLRHRRLSPFVCYADNGASGNANELPPQSEESVEDGARSSPSRPGSLISYLKQVDWMNFIFRWQKDEPLWNVPWTGQTIFQIMILWFAAFWVMGSWIIPIAAQLAGFSRHSLSFRGQALYSLITDIAEGTVGIWILRRCLARFLPLPEGWFPINLKGKWLLEACWGCLLFPLVNKLSQLNLFLLPLPTPLTTSYVEQSMMSRDPIATLLYAVVISVCAPVWEEVIFRGFLLPSMTRYLPLWGAISVSALAFALAHFSMQRILPLTFLGLVMGFVFVRSRNLLASIVLHSLWNGFAFLELL